MVVVICSICGEDWPASAEACPACEASDMRAVPEEQLASGRDARLLANVHRTLESIADLHRSRDEELALEVEERRERALRERLEGQMGIVEARMRHDRELHNAEEYRKALQDLRRELQSSL